VSDRAPRLTVITVAFNASATIARAIASVRSQTVAEVEHLLIDGLSRDDTVARARAAGDERLTIVSERDRGIYDAMNKGIARARGELCLFLNADDRLSSPDTLAHLVSAFEAGRTDVAYGDIRFVTAAGTTTRIWRPGAFLRPNLSLGWIPPHPGFTARTALLRELGGFRLDYPIAADYDLMLRVLMATPQRRVTYLPSELVVMQQGGESTASVWQMWRGLRQCAASMRSNRLPLWRVAAALKPARALAQVGSAARAALR
jgi:glycosyltransferase